MNSKFQKNLKRSHDDSDNEENANKKHAQAFQYDKEKHTYHNTLIKSSTYKSENANGIYKVNIKKSNGYRINRIGVGKTLTRMMIKNILSCNQISSNIICVHFDNREEANKLIGNGQLKMHGYEAFIPEFYSTVIGVIKNVPTDITAQEIYDEIKNEYDIIKIERMTRRLSYGHRDYAMNVKIKFSSDLLPPTVTLFHSIERVHTYIPPVLQCTGCLRYGHSIKACKASDAAKMCSNCGLKGHKRTECVSLQASCFYCKGHHEATSRNCPERIRQNNIRILMTGEKLSFREVIDKYPQYTSKNEFQLLENMQQFPPLQRNSYKNQLTGKNKFVSVPVKTRQIYAKKMPEKFSNHYADHIVNTDPSNAMNFNHNKVTEVEKEITKQNQEMRTAKLVANNDSIGGYSENESNSSLMEILENMTPQEENNQNITNTHTSQHY